MNRPDTQLDTTAGDAEGGTPMTENFTSEDFVGRPCKRHAKLRTTIESAQKIPGSSPGNRTPRPCSFLLARMTNSLPSPVERQLCHPGGLERGRYCWNQNDTMDDTNIDHGSMQFDRRFDPFDRVLPSPVKSKSPHGGEVFTDLTDLTDILLREARYTRAGGRARAHGAFSPFRDFRSNRSNGPPSLRCRVVSVLPKAVKRRSNRGQISVNCVDWAVGGVRA